MFDCSVKIEKKSLSKITCRFVFGVCEFMKKSINNNEKTTTENRNFNLSNSLLYYFLEVTKSQSNDYQIEAFFYQSSNWNTDFELLSRLHGICILMLFLFFIWIELNGFVHIHFNTINLYIYAALQYKHYSLPSHQLRVN